MTRRAAVIRSGLATLLALSLAAGAALAEGLALGDTAPMRDASMKSVSGKSVTIAASAGKKGTLVLFICNHCPWVKAWQGRIATIGNAALDSGVGVIAINSNDPSAYTEDDFGEMKARAKKVGYKFTYAMDATSDVARAFGAARTPEVFLFDAGGKLVYHGAVDDNAQEEPKVEHRWLREAVQAVAAGTAVPTPETKAMGCGVKLRAKAGS